MQSLSRARKSLRTGAAGTKFLDTAFACVFVSTKHESNLVQTLEFPYTQSAPAAMTLLDERASTPNPGN